MLKLHRFIALFAALMSFASTSYALQANDYTAFTFTTDSSNVRILDLLAKEEAVVFENADGNQEDRDSTQLELSCGNASEGCTNNEDSLTEDSLTIAGVGTIDVNDQKNIVFTPEDSTFTGQFSFDYFISSSTTDSSASATVTMVIRDSSTTSSSTNIRTIESAVTGFCDPNSDNFNQNFSADLQAACLSLLNSSGDELIDALSTISPEEVVAEFTTTINMTKDQTGNLTNRLNALRGGAQGISIAGLNYHQGNDTLPGQWIHEMANQIGGNASADQNFTALGFFINGSITSGDKDTTSLEQGYDLDADSLTIGADYRFTDTLVAGVAYGISSSDIEFSDTSNEMKNDIDNLLFYGSWYKDAFYIDGMLGYAKGDIETDRRITVGSTDEVVTGETESQQLFFSITGNFDFTKNAWTYGPYASLDVIDGEISSYDEIGTTGFEVTFSEQDIESQVLTFGGRAQYAWSQPWGIIVPHARVEWKTELEDERSAIAGRFILDTSGDNAFTIEADDLDSSWFQIGIGVSATFQHGLSAYLDYEEVVSYDDTSIDTFSFGGRWEAKF